MNFFTPEDMRRAEGTSPAATIFSAQRRLSDRAEAVASQLPTRSISPMMLSGLIRTSDYLVLCASALIAYMLYVGPLESLGLLYGSAMLALASISLVMFQIFSVNRTSAFHQPYLQGFRVVGAWSLVFLIGLGLLVFLHAGQYFSRVWLATTYFIGVLALLTERGIISLVVRHFMRSGHIERRAVVVGGGASGAALLEALSVSKTIDLRVLGFFDDRSDKRSTDTLAGYPKLGNVDDLVEFARRTNLDLAIFSLPITAEARLLQMLRKLWVLPIDIRLAAHMNKLRFRPRSYSYIGDVPVLDVFDKPIADWDVVLKAVFDRIVGSILLILLAPIMALIAIGVKMTSKGPVLFKQIRHVFNNEHIEVFKFRSMYTERLDLTAQKQVTRNDPRVTPFGRFLRKSSLDELPQLFNVVFQGNLSLVGPRPHAVAGKAAGMMYDEVVDGYFARHRVKPGITGWAQVNGWRGETDTPDKMQGRVDYDLNYIENWSIFFDLYILMITPFAMLRTKNAY